MSRIRCLILVPALILGASCRTIVDRPPLRFEQAGLTLRVHDPDAVERLVRAFSAVDEPVRELLAVHDVPPPEIWMLDRTLKKDATAIATPYAVIFPLYLPETDYVIELVMAHELVHWYVKEWPARLPIAVEEGLADLVASRVVDQEFRMVAMKAAQPVTLRVEDEAQVLSFTHPQWWATSDEDEQELRAFGFRIALENDIAGLHRLCVRAAERGLDRVPPAWLPLPRCSDCQTPTPMRSVRSGTLPFESVSSRELVFSGFEVQFQDVAGSPLESTDSLWQGSRATGAVPRGAAHLELKALPAAPGCPSCGE